MPQIAELFVALGVKGTEKTINAMASVKTGLGNIASVSLEAKAAIVGAIYALERLMSASTQRGTELSNLNALTGISVKQLQQWQYAARQAGESNEEFTGSLKSVYDKMAQMKLNKGAPEGLDIVAQTVGFDVKKAYSDVFYVFEQLQKFAHSNVPTDIQNQILKSFGVSENTIAAFRKGVFNATNLKSAPLYSGLETKQLTATGVAFDNLETKVSMFFGHFTAKNGQDIVKTLSQVADQALRVATAFERIADKLQIFSLIGKAFGGWSVILNAIADATDGKKSITGQRKEAQDTLNINQEQANIKINRQNLSSTLNSATGFFPSLIASLKDNLIESKLLLNPQDLQNGQNFTDYSHGVLKLFDNFVSPLRQQNQSTNNNANINQNLYFQHSGQDQQQVRDTHKESIAQAYKQAFGQSQAT